MAKKGQKFNKYSLETKMKAINEYLNNEKNASTIAEELGITKNTIDMWVYNYRHKNTMGNKRGRPKEDIIDYKERYQILKNYQAFLKEQQGKK